IPPRGIAWIIGAREFHPAILAEVSAAVLAVAHPRSLPAIAENPAYFGKSGDDFFRHLGHELEIVRPERARYPHIRHFPMAALLAFGVDRDPVGMIAIDVFIGRVRICPGDHYHAELLATLNHLTE